MAELARLFVHLAFLKRGPQDVPASVFLLVLLPIGCLLLALERSLPTGILLSVACAIMLTSTVALVFPAPAA